MFRRKRRVQMLVSVGGKLVAGKTYKLPAAGADELIVKGYAEGALSREFSDDEKVALRGPTQVVNFG